MIYPTQLLHALPCYPPSNFGGFHVSQKMPIVSLLPQSADTQSPRFFVLASTSVSKCLAESVLVICDLDPGDLIEMMI
jgi:hypothetical protein